MAIISANFGMNLLYHDVIPILCSCFTFFGVGNSSVGSIFSSSICSPCSLTTNPKYFTSEHPNLHFSRMIVNFALFIFSKTFSRCFKCSSKFFVTIIMSSRYQNTLGFKFGAIIVSINRWDVTGAFVNRNVILSNWYILFPGTVNAVICLDSSSSGIWWYAERRSIFDMYFADLNASKISAIIGIITLH